MIVKGWGLMVVHLLVSTADCKADGLHLHQAIIANVFGLPALSMACSFL